KQTQGTVSCQNLLNLVCGSVEHIDSGLPSISRAPENRAHPFACCVPKHTEKRKAINGNVLCSRGPWRFRCKISRVVESRNHGTRDSATMLGPPDRIPARLVVDSERRTVSSP